MVNNSKNNGLGHKEALPTWARGPQPPGSALRPLAGKRRDLEELRRDAWQEHGALTVPVDDPRLEPAERAAITGAGSRLYGPRGKGSKP